MTKFTETQAFAAWGYAVLGVSTVAVVIALAEAGLAWPVLPLALVFNLLCLRTTVTEQELTIRLGALFPLYRRRIALMDIASAVAVTYSPLADFGGWGIKGSPGNIALNACGNRGVQLILRDGRRVLVGSQQPDELAEALTPPSPQ